MSYLLGFKPLLGALNLVWHQYQKLFPFIHYQWVTLQEQNRNHKFLLGTKTLTTDSLDLSLFS